MVLESNVMRIFFFLEFAFATERSRECDAATCCMNSGHAVDVERSTLSTIKRVIAFNIATHSAPISFGCYSK